MQNVIKEYHHSLLMAVYVYLKAILQYISRAFKMCMFLHPGILLLETYPMVISKNMVKLLLIIVKHWQKIKAFKNKIV